MKSLIKGYGRERRVGHTGVQLSGYCSVEAESVGIEALKARTTVK
jgi:hypothetical protein